MFNDNEDKNNEEMPDKKEIALLNSVKVNSIIFLAVSVFSIIYLYIFSRVFYYFPVIICWITNLSIIGLLLMLFIIAQKPRLKIIFCLSVIIVILAVADAVAMFYLGIRFELMIVFGVFATICALGFLAEAVKSAKFIKAGKNI